MYDVTLPTLDTQSKIHVQNTCNCNW